MPGLDELRVSLTKNGYFKVAEVIRLHPRNEVLDSIHGVHDGINLNRAQIANMLSADEETEELPPEWDEIRTYPPRAIQAFTFLSILFSHVDFIRGFAESHTSEMRGVIHRGDLGEKAYTNLVFTMADLGLCDYRPGEDSVTYNLAPLFRDMSIGPLVKRILHRKLRKTHWQEPGPDDHFTRGFYEQCFHYGFHKTLGISQRQFRDWLEGHVVEVEAPPPAALREDTVVVSSVLLAALSTKPFVVIAGTTGTGKTATARQLVDALRPNEVSDGFNHVFIPVEAGWTDARHLLGFKNPFGSTGETYSTTPLLSLLLRANHPAYSQIPFFVLLDEMNLSYVEMYFSRFLSLMETTSHGRPEPILDTETLRMMLRSTGTPLEATYIDNAIASGGLFLTKNVFIVGTVNVDETTHMFSPKVLDRSFVLEFGTIRPSETSEDFRLHPDDELSGSASILSRLLIEIRTLPSSHDIDDFLDDLHTRLGRFRFGPRVTIEAQKYAAATEALISEATCSEEFRSSTGLRDRILLQKVLPKLHGNRSQLSAIVDSLLEFARGQSLSQSIRKLESMKADLTSPGFTNFFA